MPCRLWLAKRPRRDGRARCRCRVERKDPAVTRARFDTLVPIIEVITEFTDGDETNHVRSELIEVVAKVAPERLPSLYEHHLSTDDYSYADECLIELAKVMDFGSPEGAALARTFLDERTLGVLEDRAVNEPAACALLAGQNAFPAARRKLAAKSRLRKKTFPNGRTRATKVDPISFGYEDFAAVVKAASAVHYKTREEFMVKNGSITGRISARRRALYARFSTISRRVRRPTAPRKFSTRPFL